MRPILVFGHRNPDSDSICAAVAYAHLRNRVDPERVHVPVRLGEVPPETRWLFDRFGVPLPELIDHVRLRVRDAMTEDVVTVHADDPLAAAGLLMREHDIRAVPVVDDGRVLGVVSTETLAGRYLDLLDAIAAGSVADKPAPAARDVMDTQLTTVDPDALLADAAEELFASAHRSAVVVGADGALAGILTRTSLARAGRREVVLVDHNERAQSADGIEEALVVEVVDHHRVGDIETASPISFVSLPVGSTCTIVATRYFERDIEPPDRIAVVMLGAILSDTVLLKSPTTTSLDREVAERLARIAGVDALEFGMEMYRARVSAEPFSAEKVVSADLKEFPVAGTVAGIAQYETPDAAGVLGAHRGELREALERLRERRGWGFALLMVTDVVLEGTELLAAGDVRAVEKAFGHSFASGSAWLPGVLSRKKQVAAPLLG